MVIIHIPAIPTGQKAKPQKPGKYTDISGNKATALGLLAATERAG